MPTSLVKVWETFESSLLDPIDAPEVQRLEMKKAFFAGATTMSMIIDRIGAMDDEAKAIQAFNQVHLELDRVLAEFTKPESKEQFEWKSAKR